jgi:hypothetical protein
MSTAVKIRKLENLHIVFWLFKDMSWCMEWKLLGIIMILPTIGLTIYTIYQTRNNRTELIHNLAVLCWIIANSYWMISEFYSFDEKLLVNSINYKHIALFPFVLGVIILIWFYLGKKLYK